MKRSICLIWIALLTVTGLPTHSNAQSAVEVFRQTKPQLVRDSTWFRLIAGDPCRFERSKDEGRTWISLSYFPYSYEENNGYVTDRVVTSILSAVMLDEKNGYATGLKHYAWHQDMFRELVAYSTSDSGKSWKESYLPSYPNDEVPLIRKVFSPKTWLMQSVPRREALESYGSRLTLTTNAAKSSRIYFDSLRNGGKKYVPYIEAVDAADTARAIVCAGGHIHSTSDAGRSWIEDDTVAGDIPASRITCVKFVGQSSWLAAGDSVLLKSTDNGISWRVLERPAANFIDLQIAGGQAIALTSESYAFISIDSGSSWHATELAFNRRICHSIGFTPSGELFCFGDTIWKFGSLFDHTPRGVLSLPEYIGFWQVKRDSIARKSFLIRNVGSDTINILSATSDHSNFSVSLTSLMLPPDSATEGVISYSVTSPRDSALISILTPDAANTFRVGGTGRIGSLSLVVRDIDLGPSIAGELRSIVIPLTNIGTDQLRLMSTEQSSNIPDLFVNSIISKDTTIANINIKIPLQVGMYTDSIRFYTDGSPSTDRLLIRYDVIESPKTLESIEIQMPSNAQHKLSIDKLVVTDTQVIVASHDDNIPVQLHVLAFDNALSPIWDVDGFDTGRHVVGLYSYGNRILFAHSSDEMLSYDSITADGTHATFISDTGFVGHGQTISASDRYVALFGQSGPSGYGHGPYTEYDEGSAMVRVFDLTSATSQVFRHAGTSSYQTHWTNKNGKDWADAAAVSATGAVVVSGTVDTYYGWNDPWVSPIYHSFFWGRNGLLADDHIPAFSQLLVDGQDRTLGLQGSTLYLIQGDSTIGGSCYLPLEPKQILPTQDGGLIAIGSMGNETHLVKVSPLFRIDWSRHISTTGYGSNICKMAVDKDQNIYAVVESQPGQLTFTRHSPKGDLEWIQRVGDASSQYSLRDIALTADAAMIVGAERRRATAADVLLVFPRQLAIDVDTSKEIQNTSGVLVSPNPASSSVSFHCIPEIQRIDIFDVLGKPRLTSTERSIDVRILDPGVYMVRLITTEEAVLTTSFVKY